MADIHQSVVVPGAPEAVYAALATSDGHRAFTGAEAAISQEAGGSWSAYGGGIVGRNVELVPGERLVQAWRAADWPAGTWSLVTLQFWADAGGTRVALHHAGVPEASAPHIDAGWHARYWEPLRVHFSD